ncbi:MAG: hypothetical protein M1587_08320 [Thaumarchaeota archaeon]|nr:hypothetical protein [Nitrososphaerota archaeon]
MPAGKFRVAKYAVKVISLIISLIIILAIAGPPLGFLTQGRISTNIGFSVDTSQIQSQMNAIFSSGTDLTQPHEIIIPVHNVWVFPADASVVIDLEVAGSIVYETSGNVTLQAFQSGQIFIPFQITQSQLSQLQGNQITVGGGLTFGDPGYLWTITIPFSQGGSQQ